MKKRTLALLLAAMLLMSLLAGCSSKPAATEAPAPAEEAPAEEAAQPPAETIVWKLACSSNADTANGIGCQRFADLVKERTNGRYEITVYPGATLASAADSVNDILTGTLELSLVNASILVKDYEQADKLFIDNLDYWSNMMEEEGGFMAMSIFETGWRDISNSVRDIRSAEDCKGLRIRVMQNNTYIEAWQMLGADPVPMDWSEAYVAMQQGAIDAQDNPAALNVSNNIPEIHKYFSPINYIYSCIPLIMNVDAWNSLSEEDQAIFQECANEAAVYQRELCRQYEEEAYDNMEAQGVNIIKDVDRDSFQEVLAPLVDKYKDVYGEEIEFINSVE